MTEPFPPPTAAGAGDAPVLSLARSPAERRDTHRPPLPRYPAGEVGRLLAALHRHWGTALTALLCSWSGIWLALWLLAATTVVGALVGLLGAALSGGGAPSIGGGLLAVLGGGVAGAAGAIGTALRSLLLDHPLQLLSGLAGGALIAGLGSAAAARLEATLLGLRGCRRLSRRESARIAPLVAAAARDLGLTERPGLLVSGSGSLRVRAHARHIVIGRALLDELPEGEEGNQSLTAVLAHGLAHWAAGDGAADGLIFACGLPLAIVYNAGCGLARQPSSLLALAGWIVLWPAWLLVRLVLEPISSLASRRREYEADAAVRAAGRGTALHRALSFLGELESGGSGWERALGAAHPPLELRLEALDTEEWPE